MKKISFLLLISCFSVTKNNAQTLTTYSVLNTSYDRASGTFFSLGSIDNYWFLTQIQDFTVPLNPATLINYSNAPTYVVPNSGNNTFSGIINDNSINFANNTTSPGSKLITYRTYFNIPNLTTHGYDLEFVMSADDAVDNVKLNGVEKGKFLDANYNNIPGVDKPYLLNIPACDTSYRTGLNYIDITIADAGGTIGFYGEIYLSESSASCPSEVGIKEYDTNYFLFSISPNPTTDEINLIADAKLIGLAYSIYDYTGKIILTGKIKEKQNIIKLDSVSVGIYLLTINADSKQSFKIVKQ